LLFNGIVFTCIVEWVNCKGTSFSVKVLIEQTNKFIPNDKRSENKCTKVCLAAVLCYDGEITCHLIQMVTESLCCA